MVNFKIIKLINNKNKYKYKIFFKFIYLSPDIKMHL